MTKASRQDFSPLCDVHHTSMQRVMLEEESEEVRSYHACNRRDCTRIFRTSGGYSDRVEGEFDDSRSSARTCSSCGAALYLAEVDHALKVEIWECTQSGCDHHEEIRSPSSR